MSQDIICHFSPVGGVDDRIASVLNDGYSKEDIGTLRGLYDMEHKKPLVIIPEGANESKMFSGQDILEAAQKLMEYKSSQAQRHLAEMKDSTSHMAKTFNRLYHVPGWNVETRRNRINMIVSEFTKEVSRRMKVAQKAGISITREQIVNGYKSNGEFHEGQLSVFESIFDMFLAKYNKARETLSDADGITDEELRQSYIEENEERAEDEKWTDKQIEEFVKGDRQAISNAERIVTEYPKIFQNWSALCAFARMSLRDTESLKLGQTFEYAAPTSPDNFSMDSPLEDTYDLEESVREAWMTHQSETSAYGSLGAEVRRFLATITDVDAEGNKMTDDLGYQIKMDPLEMHQYLADLLRGIISESSMIRKLRSLSENDPRVNAVFDALAKASQADLRKSIDNSNKPKNPTILTQLLIDMHKNMVPYSALLKTAAGNVYAKILNRQANPLHDEFILRMQLNQAVDPANSIYDREGKVDWEKLAQWNAESAILLPAPEKREVSSTNLFAGTQVYNGNGKATGFWALNHAQRIDYMKRAATALGIPMTDKAARRIYNNATLRKAYLTALQEFRTTTREVHSGDVLKDLRVLEKYNGMMPSVNAGFTAEQRTEYVEALNRLKERNISYKSFRKKKYKSDKNPKSKGAGNERINKMLDNLADVSNYLKTERRVSWFDRKGKANSRYSDRTPSYMGDLVDKIHEFVNEGDAQGLKDFIMDKWGQSSFFYDKEAGRFLNRWLQEMYDSIRTDTKGNVIIDPDAMAKVFEFDEFLGSNIDKQVSIFENFTEKQHAEAMMKQFVQMLDQSHGKSKLAKYPCFILGDSGAQMFFTAKRYSKAEIMDGLKDVFKQEIERMKYVKATNEVLEKGGFKTIDNFSDTANEFTMMKFFNPDYADGKYWKILTGNQNMTDAELKNLSQEEAIDMAKEAIGTDALTDALQQYMDDAKADFMKKLASVGVLAENKGEGGVITYTDPKGYFSQNIKWFDNSIDKLVEDFYWNTKYATIQQLQMFTVDPAFYDHRYPIKDLQKRYKEIYAPGKGVSIEARDFDGNLFVNRDYETAVYFDDIAVSSKDVNPYFFKLMQKTFGENHPFVQEGKGYQKNTLTDGQGYRSLESYRAVKGMAGEWTRPMEEAYKRIKSIRNSGRELTKEDVKEIAQLAVIFQPIKPYLYTLEKLQINDSGDMALIPVQHKYAEIVLIPELMQDGKLKDMAKWMEENDVDLVASTKCVKVGAFGSAELKGANSTQSIYDALGKGYVHKLSWSDYRIQSGVPEHLNHAQLFGTQIRKLILANINKGNNYDYLNNILGVKTNDPLGPTVYLPGMGNVHLTGRNLISFYNCLVMANLFDSYNKFSGETSTNQALSDKMIQNITSNANQAEDNAFGFSLIDDGDFKGEFVIPPGEPGMEHDAAALLYSLFKKNVNKQKIKGGSAVQASPMGLRGYEESGELFEMVSPEGDNVLYDEIEMPFNLSYTSSDKKDVSLKFEDWCYTEVTDDEYGHHEIGDLKLSGRIVYGEEAREYLSWPVSGRNKNGRPNQVDENGYDPNGYYVPLVEEKYKGILDIIAYRIPTERDYSMINCKVFRFSNPLAGGTMKVPSSRTTTAGFDFDIDKLYFFMREFAQTHLSEREKADIWSKIYGLKYDKNGKVIDGNEIYRALKEVKNLDKIGAERLGDAAEMFERSETLKNVANESEENKLIRLHEYWEAAGLEGTAEEAFTKYLEDHREEYPIFDTYNPAISPLQNSRVSRNNMLIDLIRQRLMDKETLKARYTPGGFDNNREAALRMRVLQHGQADVEVEGQHVRIIRDGKISWPDVDKYVSLIQEGKLKDPEPEYDPSDPTAILVYNQQNQVAGKLIGIFANQNTNHVYASTMEELTLREPIRFGNHISRGLQDMLHAPEGVDVDTNVSEYLAASVDAVKDPVLNFLNLNLVTADAGALLARIGYTPQEIGLLFNQPIIKELCNYVANENVSTDVAITEMLKKYGGKNATLEKMVFDATQVTSDRLANNIISRRDNASNDMTAAFKQGQLQVLWLFNEIMADTADVNSFVQCTRFTAANSVGSTSGDQIAQEERVSNFIEKYMNDYSDEKNDPRRLSFKLFDESETLSNRVVHAGEANMFTTNQGILNIDEKLLDLSPEEYMAQMSRNPLAFEQCMMDLSRKNTRTLFKKHFPYYTQLYNNMRDVMRRLTKYGGLDADTSNSLHRDFMVFLLSKQKGSAFDGEALWPGFDGRSGFTNRQFYKEVFPELLVTLKDSGVLADYPFFSALNITGDSEMGLLSNEEDVKDGTSPNALRISVQGMGGLQSRTSNLITEAWAQAFNSEDVVSLGGMDFAIKDLAEWCYYYNFYRLGYNFHPTSFMNLAPTLLKLGLRTNTSSKENGYIDFINQVINGEIHLDTNDLMLFAKQYMLNHLDNKKFVFSPKGHARSLVNNKAFNEAGGYWNNEFSISLNELGKDVASQFTVSDDSLRQGMTAFRPIIALERNGNIVYYMANSSEEKFNIVHTVNGTMKYKQVYMQGIKGKSIQYFGNAAYEAFQNQGSLIGFKDNSSTMNPADNRSNGNENTDGEVAPTPEGTHIEIGTDISSMFTDAEWQSMFSEFKKDNTALFSRDDMQGFDWVAFRQTMLDTNDSQNVEILNDLLKRIDRGEKMQTINDEGKPTDVC